MQAGQTIRTVYGDIATVIEVTGNVLLTTIGYVHVTKCKAI